ncbi:MAG: tail fiber domain-containing protein [Terracidiphilus sp.]
MKDIRTAILAGCLVILGSLTLQAQFGNAAYGSGALVSNTTGYQNSAFGSDALYANTAGFDNSAFGSAALQNNTIGGYNSAFGTFALIDNTVGSSNSALGYEALFFNSTGTANDALGYLAMNKNTTGFGNSAIGQESLYSNTTGGENVADGTWALNANTTGSYNIGLGYAAGYYNPTASSYNIDIGNYGTVTDNGVIRLGTPGKQTAFYLAGVYGTAVGNGASVEINSSGQLGIVNSSIRFKEDIHDMGDASNRLYQLRPVTYRYKEPSGDDSKPRDYGLIAEEVAQVYPDLVVKNADGQIQTVQYQKLVPMLLNEVQKQHKLLQQQEEILNQQAETIQQLKTQHEMTIDLLVKRLTALEKGQLLAKSESKTATE